MLGSSTIISIVYASIYASVFIASSIYCLWELKHKQHATKPIDKQSAEDGADNIEIDGIQEHITLNTVRDKEEKQSSAAEQERNSAPTDSTNHGYDGNFVEDWLKSIWHKKKIYWAILPHIFDQATDVGVIYQYYVDLEEYEAQKNDTGSTSEGRALNPFWFFVFGIIIIVFQRIISTVTIYAMTHNPKAALLQFVDLLMVKAVWINYVLGLEEPCNPQRYIQLLEACFESSPQIILSMGYILKSMEDGHEIAGIVVISTVFSLWSLTSKVASDDKLLFPEDQEKKKIFRNLNLKFRKRACFIQFNWWYIVRVILWRFFEISSRVCLCVLIWINVGGLALVIILGVELLFCLIFWINEKTPDVMGNMMYITFVYRVGEGHVRLFWVYRISFFYIYAIMVTVSRIELTVDSTLRLSMLIYTWIAGVFWQFALCTMAMWSAFDEYTFSCCETMSSSRKHDMTTRDLIGYVMNYQFTEAHQLLKFGYVVQDDYTDRGGNTLLHAVCSRVGMKEMVTGRYNLHYYTECPVDMVFLEEVFNANPTHINARNKRRETPLRVTAGYSANIQVMEFLLKHGADMNNTLQIVVQNDANIEVIDFLLKHGADINATNGFYETPIIVAADMKNGNTEMGGNGDIKKRMRNMEYLISKGAECKSLLDWLYKNKEDDYYKNHVQEFNDIISLLTNKEKQKVSLDDDDAESVGDDDTEKQSMRILYRYDGWPEPLVVSIYKSNQNQKGMTVREIIQHIESKNKLNKDENHQVEYEQLRYATNPTYISGKRGWEKLKTSFIPFMLGKDGVNEIDVWFRTKEFIHSGVGKKQLYSF